ncbi:hypothetical protein quinque_008825 [Culex quinquefasciatus]
MEGKTFTKAGVEIDRASAGNVRRSKEESAIDTEQEDCFGYTTYAILELLLAKKYYDKSLRKQSRNWNANLTEEGALDTDIEADYNEDPEMR